MFSYHSILGGGLTATGLVVLLLALIAAAVILYYAYICVQARPLRPKKHKDAERGPLIPPDPDVNGNHEDVPLDPTAPLHDDATNTDLKPRLDSPDQGANSPPRPKADSPLPPKDKEDVLISVEDDVPPAKVTHEKETAPVVNTPAPLGFVVPNSVVPPQDTPMDHHPAPRDHQPQPEKLESPPPPSSPPAPVYIPSPPPKKHIPISDEEDGLLLHEPASEDDSLNPDLGATLPMSHPPRKPMREKAETIPQAQPSPPLSQPKPEGAPPAIPSRQPAAVPKVDPTPQPEAQPVVVVVPQTAPTCPEKEELKPVGKAVDTPCNKPPAPIFMEDDELLPSAASSKDVNNKTPIPAPDEVPVTKAASVESLGAELENPVNKETAVDSDDSLSAGNPSESVEPILKSVDNNEPAKDLSDNDKEEPIPEKTDVHEDSRSVSSCSVSSEEPELPSPTPINAEIKAEPVAPLEPSHTEPREDEEVTAGDTPASAPTAPESPSDAPPSNTTVIIPEKEHTPTAPVHSPADEAEVLAPADEAEVLPTADEVEVLAPADEAEVLPAADEAEVLALADEAEVLPAADKAEILAAADKTEVLAPADKAEVLAPADKTEVLSAADEAEVVSDASSDVSDTNDIDENILTEMPVTSPKTEMNPTKETPATPSQPAADIPLDASNVPMEAYNVMLDDTSDEENSPLPVIKEEGSVENNSEGATDTDSSEPDVTEYSFSSGPSAPSTTGVLANEVSCTLEPKVTKFSQITDLDASESEGSEISDDDDLDEDDSASLHKSSDDECDDNTKSLPENKVIPELKATNTTEKNNVPSNHSNSSDDEDSVADMEPILSSNGPVAKETLSSPSKVPLNETSDLIDSDTESEGVEADVELKEEIVTTPAIVLENTNNHTAAPPKSESTSPSTNHTGNPAEACPPKPHLLKAHKGNKNLLETIPSAVDDDGLSLSPSESCDLSDGEVTASTPKKSMIPRFVKQSEA